MDKARENPTGLSIEVVEMKIFLVASDTREDIGMGFLDNSIEVPTTLIHLLLSWLSQAQYQFQVKRHEKKRTKTCCAQLSRVNAWTWLNTEGWT